MFNPLHYKDNNIFLVDNFEISLSEKYRELFSSNKRSSYIILFYVFFRFLGINLKQLRKISTKLYIPKCNWNKCSYQFGLHSLF